MSILFEKMEGIGNDFIIIDDRDGRIKADYGQYSELAQRLCSRNFGIGGDGIIILLASETEDVKFRIFNLDGSEAQMCGNGMRCFAKYLFENKIINKKKIRVETCAGRIIPEIITDSAGNVESVCVDMGEPILNSINIPLNIKDKVFHITAVSMGNPHAVIFVDDVDNFEVEEYGKAIENHNAFPEKTNVEFVEIINREHIKMRVWERGAGETLACGTGACAVLVAANLNNKAERKAKISLRGGNLDIEWREADNHIYKTGPARVVFTGKWNSGR